MTRLEQQLQASVDLNERVVPREKLPTDRELEDVHAMLEVLCEQDEEDEIPW